MWFWSTLDVSKHGLLLPKLYRANQLFLTSRSFLSTTYTSNQPLRRAKALRIYAECTTVYLANTSHTRSTRVAQKDCLLAKLWSYCIGHGLLPLVVHKLYNSCLPVSSTSLNVQMEYSIQKQRHQMRCLYSHSTSYCHACGMSAKLQPARLSQSRAAAPD